MVFAALGAAQDRMVETLRQGVVEEESKQNLGAAIQDYQAVLSQFNDARQTAATALFRMAECYRKQGNGPQAMTAYRRVVREFADQSKLAEQSRNTLTGTYHVAAENAESEILAAERARQMENLNEQEKQKAKQTEARERYRQSILQEMDLVQKQINRIKQGNAIGSIGNVAAEELTDPLTEKLLQLQRELAAFDAGMPPPGR